MALLKFGSVITKLSGKINSQMICLNARGNYIKSIGTYKKTFTNKSQISKNTLMLFTQMWRTLTPSQAKGWDGLGTIIKKTNRVGEVVPSSGYELFVQFAYNMYLQNEPYLTNAPAVTTVKNVTSLVLHCVASVIYLECLGTDPNNMVKLYCAGNIGANSKANHRDFRLIGVYPSTTFSTSQDINSDIETVFGPLVQGRSYHFIAKGFDANTGQPTKNDVGKSVLFS